MTKELLLKVLLAAVYIEGREKVVGALSSAQKVKSLLQQWLAKAADALVPGGDPLNGSSIIIERNTIVMVKVKVGRGIMLILCRITFVLSIFLTNIIISGSCQRNLGRFVKRIARSTSCNYGCWKTSTK